jgi:integrase
VQSQLNAGTYDETTQRTWANFRKEYETKIAEGMDSATRTFTVNALDAFERIVKPAKMVGVNSQAIDEFIRRRGKEPGKKRGSLVSPATVNKDLRHLRPVLTVAVEWGYLKDRPRVRMVKEPKKHVTFVKAEDFAAIYQACEEHARLPGDLTCSAAASWRALLVFAYMTGFTPGDRRNATPCHPRQSCR